MTPRGWQGVEWHEPGGDKVRCRDCRHAHEQHHGDSVQLVCFKRGQASYGEVTEPGGTCKDGRRRRQ